MTDGVGRPRRGSEDAKDKMNLLDARRPYRLLTYIKLITI